MLGYLCAWLRHYYPIEFLTAFLNNAANDEDIANGTAYARKIGIKVTMPKWGVSKSNYFFNKEEGLIAKGLSSIKYMSKNLGEDLLEIAKNNKYASFTDLLYDISAHTNLDSKQMEILISIDFFSKFGNQTELRYIENMFNKNFKKGQAKKIKKSSVDGTKLQPVIEKYAVGTTKSGGVAKQYTLLDNKSMLNEIEQVILSSNLQDVKDFAKIRAYKEATGYMGYITGDESDNPKLYVTKVTPLKRKKDGIQFGYSIFTKSIGSGKESRFTVFNRVYDQDPISEEDIIFCKSYELNNGYFTLKSYERMI